MIFNFSFLYVSSTNKKYYTCVIVQHNTSVLLKSLVKNIIHQSKYNLRPYFITSTKSKKLHWILILCMFTKIRACLGCGNLRQCIQFHSQPRLEGTFPKVLIQNGNTYSKLQETFHKLSMLASRLIISAAHWTDIRLIV